MRAQNDRSQHRRQAGFTLVELLVVTAIISVLAGLLLPVLNQAIHTAQSASCQNNQRQIAVALLSYADETAGWLPCLHPTGSAGDYQWFTNKLIYGGFLPKPEKWLLESWGNVVTGVWRCLTLQPECFQWCGGFGVNENHLMKRGSSTNLGRLNRPSAIWLIGDNICDEYAPARPLTSTLSIKCPLHSAWGLPGAFSRWADPRHGGFANYACTDGHVTRGTYAELLSNQNDAFAHSSY